MCAPCPREYELVALNDLLAKLPALKSLTFEGGGQVPLSLLHTLETYNLNAHLHIRDFRITLTPTICSIDCINPCQDFYRFKELMKLARSPNLRSVQSYQTSSTPEHDVARIAFFKRMIAESPNLETVEISKPSMTIS
jgi:hypothetical protein